MGTHPIFESDFDCLTDRFVIRTKWHSRQNDREIRLSESVLKETLPLESRPSLKSWKRHLKLKTGKSLRNQSANGPKLMANSHLGVIYWNYSTTTLSRGHIRSNLMLFYLE